MKKHLPLILLCLFVTIAAKAQTNAGNQAVSLNFGYASNTNSTVFSNPAYASTLTTTSKQTTYSVTPGYSVFVAKNLDIGVAAGLTGSITNNDYAPTPSNPTKIDYRAYSGTIYLRKYFLFQDKIGVRTGPYFLYQKSTQKNEYPAGSVFNNNADNTVDTYSTGLNLDFVYYPSRKIGLSANLLTLAYNYLRSTTADGTGTDNTTGKGFNASLITNNLSVSVFFIFGGK